jgi:hypothetical protein
LLAALSGPEQDDDRQENKRRHPGGEASDRHDWKCFGASAGALRPRR